MAMLNWEGWAANFLGWGSVGAATPAPAPTPVGGGKGKRRRGIVVRYKEREYEFRSEHEAEQFVESLRTKLAKPAPKPVAKPAPKAKPQEPPQAVLQAPPDMGHLRALVDAYNAQRAAEYRAAMEAWEREIERDDAEVFALLRKMNV